MRIPPALTSAVALTLSLAPAPAVLAQHDHQGHGDHSAHMAAATAEQAIAAAVAAPSRTPANTARDRYRHPAETLTFFGVAPGQTVVEFSPSGGWYTEILAPLLKDNGTLYGAQAPGRHFYAFTAKLASEPAVYGAVNAAEWPDTAGVIPPGSVDTVLTFRNIHNLVMAGTAEETFRGFFALLKPGGTLGIVEHRLPEKRDTAAEKSSGYLKESTVKRLATEAGFEFVVASEVNANPKDTADWENGVWTLPPVLRNGDVDRDKYLAIGESDRMTLKFRKPAP